MKNRKSLLSVVLLVLVLVLGVGYAVVTSTGLTINGAAGTLTSDTEIAVSFKEVQSKTDAYVDAASVNGKSASFTVKDLSRINDTAEIVYVIQNGEKDIAATLSKPSITVTKGNAEDDDYFEVTTEYADKGDTQALAAEGTTTLKVTVKLIKTPTSAKTATITVGLTATPEAQ